MIDQARRCFLDGVGAGVYDTVLEREGFPHGRPVPGGEELFRVRERMKSRREAGPVRRSGGG